MVRQFLTYFDNLLVYALKLNLQKPLTVEEFLGLRFELVLKHNKVPLNVQTSNGGKNNHKQQKQYFYIKPQIRGPDLNIEALLPAVVKELELLQKTIEEPP